MNQIINAIPLILKLRPTIASSFMATFKLDESYAVNSNELNKSLFDLSEMILTSCKPISSGRNSIDKCPSACFEEISQLEKEPFGS
jgi:hypothetical protein